MTALTSCTHTLNGGPLVCVRTDVHGRGHVYHGRDVDDGKHDDKTDEA